MILGPERIEILRKMRDIREQLDLEEADKKQLLVEYNELLAKLLDK